MRTSAPLDCRALGVVQAVGYAGVAKLVDALDLGSSAARRESSSLSFRTIYRWIAQGRADAIAPLASEIYCQEMDHAGVYRNDFRVGASSDCRGPADRVDGAVDQRLREAAQNVRLPGFRPGKVPMRVMKQRFGAGVRQEVLGEVISQSFQEAVHAENLRPAGQPSIEPKSLDAGKDLNSRRSLRYFQPSLSMRSADSRLTNRLLTSLMTMSDEIIGIFRKQQGSLR